MLSVRRPVLLVRHVGSLGCQVIMHGPSDHWGSAALGMARVHSERLVPTQTNARVHVDGEDYAKRLQEEKGNNNRGHYECGDMVSACDVLRTTFMNRSRAVVYGKGGSVETTMNSQLITPKNDPWVTTNRAASFPFMKSANIAIMTSCDRNFEIRAQI